MKVDSTAFADTIPMCDTADPKRKTASLSFTACGCPTPMLHRVPRALWMRFFPAVRLYCCRNCGTRVLRRRISSPGALTTTGYLPPYYLPASTRHGAPARQAAPVLQLVLPSELLNLLRATRPNATTSLANEHERR
jgi:hypothetical protein